MRETLQRMFLPDTPMIPSEGKTHKSVTPPKLLDSGRKMDSQTCHSGARLELS